ncbi:branched-chain amino acid ABC transporter permease [Candidatus Uhrbacteria bacterium]|nr:branched-chain amino acid ABC transporter permease [Candidatus Uhrbacteria bacterium]
MEYALHLFIFSGISVILALALNAVVGFNGFLSLASPAFYGIGAYAAAIFLKDYHIPFFFALLLAMIVTAVPAAGIGLVLSRLKEDYYMLASLGFASIAHRTFVNWRSVTNGSLGFAGVPRVGDIGEVALWTLGAIVVVWGLLHLLMRSSFGRILRAIREDELVTATFGIKTAYFKLAIFVISAMFMALGGAIYATYLTYVDPAAFHPAVAILLLAMVVVGGLASLPGAVLGAVVLNLLPELLRFFGFPPSVIGQVRLALYGLVLTLLMLYRPRGFMGAYKL